MLEANNKTLITLFFVLELKPLLSKSRVRPANLQREREGRRGERHEERGEERERERERERVKRASRHDGSNFRREEMRGERDVGREESA